MIMTLHKRNNRSYLETEILKSTIINENGCCKIKNNKKMNKINICVCNLMGQYKDACKMQCLTYACSHKTFQNQNEN